MQPLMSALQQAYGAEGLDVVVDSIGEPTRRRALTLVTSAPAAGNYGSPPVPTSSPPTTQPGAAASVTPDPDAAGASGPAGTDRHAWCRRARWVRARKGMGQAVESEDAGAVPNGQPVKGQPVLFR